MSKKSITSNCSPIDVIQCGVFFGLTSSPKFEDKQFLVKFSREKKLKITKFDKR